MREKISRGTFLFEKVFWFSEGKRKDVLKVPSIFLLKGYSFMRVVHLCSCFKLYP